jgi:Copper chaperone
MKITLKIKGMHCEHCKMRIEQALLGLSGVSKADASLTWKKATLETDKDISDVLLKDTINELGFEVTDIKR